MSVHHLYFLKRAPFLRILLGTVAGIILQWYLQWDVRIWYISFVAGLLSIACFSLQTISRKFRGRALTGTLATALTISFGGIITWHSDVRNDTQWIGSLKEYSYSVAVLQEPLIEKQNSFKALSRVYLFDSSKKQIGRGSFIIYFEKDSSLMRLNYGSTISFQKKIQLIRSSGNPAAFDYQRYCIFQGITHQVYLKNEEFQIQQGRDTRFIKRLLFEVQDRVLEILRTNIPGDREAGLAEALLIGYKNDLDKSLVQSYSNTGVVHVIAISGLHIGLIYWLLELLFKPFGKRKIMRWLKPVLILAGLWGFSLLAGAQPSVLRSAVMFTCIVVADSISRKSSIYNTLAFSAFILLCYNPYWLWDAGFQLSYTAVLSILIFMKPVYNLVFIKSRVMDAIWKLIAVTLAAQILTLPVSVFNFHQFPNYFILTNIVAVPLSSLIVLSEIFLCAVSFVPVVAEFSGEIISLLIGWMNSYIEVFEKLPYAMIESLQVSLIQMYLLYGTIAAVELWRLEGYRPAARVAMSLLLTFSILRIISFNEARKQQRMIVYNIPKVLAIDIFIGRNHFFVGDTAVDRDQFLSSFHLKPARIYFRGSSIRKLKNPGDVFSIGNKTILLLKDSMSINSPDHIRKVDILIISCKRRMNFKDLARKIRIGQVVVPGSASYQKKYWRRECDSLNIPFHDVVEKGAFVVNFN